MSETLAEFPAKLRFLFEPHRYKVAHGGRGSAKSWSFARALLIQGAQRPSRVLCAREFQNSIAASVHQLLADQIDALGLASFYEVQTTCIRGVNGTEFAFEGLRHNAHKIKSYEGVDVCWVEEAQTVSNASWELLVPTVRKDGSEIWVTFNPQLATDPTYQRFCLRPVDGVVAEVNWQDNPWFPEVLRAEKDELKGRDMDAYLNVWEGKCRQALEGAVYKDELRQAQAEGRIGRVPYDPARPVHTFWDLGWSDSVAIWMVQAVGLEFRFIDYYENRQKPLDHYVATLQARPYVWGTDWLPHDARATTLASGGKSIEEQVRALNRNVQIVPMLSVDAGIQAARVMFRNAWIDDKRCDLGLQMLRHYRYDHDPETGALSKHPLHDQSSHCADAFRMAGVALRADRPKQTPRKDNGWIR